MILVTPKQEVERKSEWFCDVKIFHSKARVRERCLNEKSLTRSWVSLFACGVMTFSFTVFYDSKMSYVDLILRLEEALWFSIF